MSSDLPLDKIEKAYFQAAKIVARYGEKYLPIFERMEKEYHDKKDRVDAMNRAIKINERKNGIRT